MTVFNLTQKFKNINRFRQILNVLVQHGFYGVVESLKIDQIRLKWSTKSPIPPDHEHSRPVRLRRAFETLGPTFIKLGQILSMREDLIPQDYIKEFKKLLDNVPPFGFEKIKETIKNDLGQNPETLFKEISPIPIAAASIGQVHKGLLHDGTVIVIKVQRPDIQKIIDTDISILFTLAHMLEKVPELAFLRPVMFIKELNQLFKFELDYFKEAENTERFAHNFHEKADVITPKVYWDLTSKRILTLEYIHGKSLAKIEKYNSLSQYDLQHLSQVLVNAVFQQIFIDGFFHADFHDGNILFTPENNLCLVDFGIVGHLNKQFKYILSNMFIALVAEDYDDLIDNFIEITEIPPQFDRLAFQSEVKKILEPYYNLPLKDINLGTIIIEFAKTSVRYQASIPREMILLAKMFTSLESLTKRLDPNLNVIQEGNRLAKILYAQEIDPDRLLQSGILMGRDISSLVRILPKQMKIFTKALNNGNIRFQVHDPQINHILQDFVRTKNNQSTSIMIAALLIGSSIMLTNESNYLFRGTPITWILGSTGFFIVFTVGLLKMTSKLFLIFSKKRKTFHGTRQ